MPSVCVQSKNNVQYTDTTIEAKYVYHTTLVTKNTANGAISVEPVDLALQFRTARKPSKCGVMLVGWGGNNGTTVTAGILANRHDLTWRTKTGLKRANYYGSITQSSTLNLGLTRDREEVFAPLKDVVPMLNPNDLVIGGWDCSDMNIGDAMRRAQVLDVTLQDAVYDYLKVMKPLPAVFDIEFVAENQRSRANNVKQVKNKKEAVEALRRDIREFRESNGLEKVIVLWTANTERFSDHVVGIHDTVENLLTALEKDEKELAPSLLYAMAAVMERCSFINGAPQNTFCRGLVEFARRQHVFVGGDDFKSGQTKVKSALVEFFVGAGIRPDCIASYNHLGNNDGLNLDAPKQFRSKEITKTNVIDDMVSSNEILFPEGSKKPDHCVVIKYLPHVGDSKRAMDEYNFSIFMGGEQTVVMHNTCQDSLLASPLIIDLVVLTELMERVHIKADDDAHSGNHFRNNNEIEGDKATDTEAMNSSFVQMDTILSILSYLLKAPCVPQGAPVINALSRQKQAIENVLRALVGLPPDNNMMLECRVPFLYDCSSSSFE